MKDEEMSEDIKMAIVLCGTFLLFVGIILGVSAYQATLRLDCLKNAPSIEQSRICVGSP
jgi:hypothetical protein